MLADETTLMKAIPFCDELHFMDRPSFTFAGSLGTIGMASPLSGWEVLFRGDGVPLFVHSTPNGPVTGNFKDQIAAEADRDRVIAGQTWDNPTLRQVLARKTAG